MNVLYSSYYYTFSEDTTPLIVCFRDVGTDALSPQSLELRRTTPCNAKSHTTGLSPHQPYSSPALQNLTFAELFILVTEKLLIAICGIARRF